MDMNRAPPLPPRPQQYEVRVEAPQLPLPGANSTPLPPTLVLSVLSAKLFTNNPSITGARLVIICELNGNTESSEISDGLSLTPTYDLCTSWTHQFEVPVAQERGSKLEIKLYEQYSPSLRIPLAKVDIFASQFSFFAGSTRWFPLDPVARTMDFPNDSLARFLLVLRSSISIDIAYPQSSSTEIASEMLEKPPSKLEAPEEGFLLLAETPPLPPRRTEPQLESHLSDSLASASVEIGPNRGQDAASAPSTLETSPHTAATASTNALPPEITDQPPPVPLRSFHPHVRPPTGRAASPNIFGKLSKLWSNASSSPSQSHSASSSDPSSQNRDAWFHEIYRSGYNHLPQLTSLYHAFRTHGYTNVAQELPNLSKYVFLYVPGLYSGRNPWSTGASKSQPTYTRSSGHPATNNSSEPSSTPTSPIEQTRASSPSPGPTGEGKLTRHQARVNELKALGFDARMITIPNDGTVISNARIISETVKQTFAETGKHIVIIGYSKGGVDTAAAISMTPSIAPMIRCFITLFSPIYGSHIATDIEDSVLRPVVYLGIKNLLDADTAAMKDLSMSTRSKFLAAFPLNDQIPSLSLASAVTAFIKRSSFGRPYRYILSNYEKENDGLVACQDAIYPGAEVILITGMDHTGPRMEQPFFRDHVAFTLAVIRIALDSTRSKWTGNEDDTTPNIFDIPPDHVPDHAVDSNIEDEANPELLVNLDEEAMSMEEVVKQEQSQTPGNGEFSF